MLLSFGNKNAFAGICTLSGYFPSNCCTVVSYSFRLLSMSFVESPVNQATVEAGILEDAL